MSPDREVKKEKEKSYEKDHQDSMCVCVSAESERQRERHTLTIMDRLIDHDEDFKYHHDYKGPKEKMKHKQTQKRI
jgi:hypothetical protein